MFNILKFDNLYEFYSTIHKDDFIKPDSWGLIGGNNIGATSFAPYLWKSLFLYKKLNSDYFVLGTNEFSIVNDFLKKLKVSKKSVGFNVARPWKGLVFKECDYVDPISKYVETINTVIYTKGKMYATNTDGVGILKKIKETKNLNGKEILILGSGGAAQTLPYYLSFENINSLYLTDIISEKSNILIKKYEQLYNSKNINIKSILHEDLDKILHKPELIINATPCGMVGYPDDYPINPDIIKIINKNCLVAEMIYSPAYTPFLKKVMQNGCSIISGVNMLVEQAIFSFNLAFNMKVNKKETEFLLNECFKAGEISK